MDPLMISVIIATRNRPEKIAPCLRSVLANKYSSFEIIIIDQGVAVAAEQVDVLQRIA